MSETDLVRLDDRGRISLPKALRESWQLKPDDPLLIEWNKETAFLRKPGEVLTAETIKTSDKDEKKSQN